MTYYKLLDDVLKRGDKEYPVGKQRMAGYELKPIDQGK